MDEWTKETRQRASGRNALFFLIDSPIISSITESFCCCIIVIIIWWWRFPFESIGWYHHVLFSNLKISRMRKVDRNVLSYVIPSCVLFTGNVGRGGMGYSSLSYVCTLFFARRTRLTLVFQFFFSILLYFFFGWEEGLMFYRHYCYSVYYKILF